MYASKEDLFQPITTEKDFELPDGRMVRIRALTRQEAHDLSGTTNPAMLEQRGISMGLVEPKMTPKEVERWMSAAPSGYLEALPQAILELSGMTPGSDKDAYQRFPG